MRISPRFLTLVAVGTALFVGSALTNSAYACSCLAPVEAYDQAESVFVGRVLKTEKCNPKKRGMEMPKSDKGFFGRVTSDMFKSYTCYRVEVMDNVKGEVADIVEIIGKTNPQSAACESSYVAGETLLLVESGTAPYQANICSIVPVGKDAAVLKQFEAAHGVSFDVEGIYKTEAAPEE